MMNIFQTTCICHLFISYAMPSASYGISGVGSFPEHSGGFLTNFPVPSGVGRLPLKLFTYRC